MEIEFKNTIFTSNQIIIKKKKQNIVIPLAKVTDFFTQNLLLKIIYL